MRFFFYGTLMAGSGNAAAEAVHRKLGPGIAASARGQLHAIPDPAGWYPAFAPDPEGELVHGFAYEAGPDFGPEDLRLLDRFEDCRTGDPDGSDYARRELELEVAGGSGFRAIAYVWNRPLPAGALSIAHGSFLCFLEETGFAPFRTAG